MRARALIEKPAGNALRTPARSPSGISQPRTARPSATLARTRTLSSSRRRLARAGRAAGSSWASSVVAAWNRAGSFTSSRKRSTASRMRGQFRVLRVPPGEPREKLVDVAALIDQLADDLHRPGQALSLRRERPHRLEGLFAGAEDAPKGGILLLLIGDGGVHVEREPLEQHLDRVCGRHVGERLDGLLTVVVLDALLDPVGPFRGGTGLRALLLLPGALESIEQTHALYLCRPALRARSQACRSPAGTQAMDPCLHGTRSVVCA
jgi:hypothetical protein